MDILNNHKPFGIDPASETLFKPIRPGDKTHRKHPDLNHLAPLTNRISEFQAGQRSLEPILNKMAHILSAPVRDFRVKTERSLGGFVRSRSIANRLVRLAEASPDKVYQLAVIGLPLAGGHALGFCKRGQSYHFLDSNFAWVRFENAEDFKRWLPFYLKAFTYERSLTQYTIQSIDRY